MANEKESCSPLTSTDGKFVNGGNNFDKHVARANEFIEKDNWEEAYHAIKSAIEINPQYAEGFNRIGVYHIRTGNYNEAIENLKKALRLDYSLIEAHYNLASLYMERNEYEMALPHFKEVVMKEPDDYETLYLMGVCCMKCNKDDDAKIFFTESLTVDPEYVPNSLSLAKLCIKNNDLTRAKEILLFLLKKDISLHEAHFLLGFIFKTEENYTRAMHHLKETLLVDKNNIEAYILLGECCLKMKLEKQAETFFVMASKLDSSSFHAFYNLGQLYHSQKRYSDAIYILEEYVNTRQAIQHVDSLWSETNQTEELVPVYNLLGNCFKLTNNPAKARTVWEQSLALQPEQQEIKDAINDLLQPTQLHKRISLVIE